MEARPKSQTELDEQVKVLIVLNKLLETMDMDKRNQNKQYPSVHSVIGYLNTFIPKSTGLREMFKQASQSIDYKNFKNDPEGNFNVLYQKLQEAKKQLEKDTPQPSTLTVANAIGGGDTRQVLQQAPLPAHPPLSAQSIDASVKFIIKEFIQSIDVFKPTGKSEVDERRIWMIFARGTTDIEDLKDKRLELLLPQLKNATRSHSVETLPLVREKLGEMLKQIENPNAAAAANDVVPTHNQSVTAPKK